MKTCVVKMVWDDGIWYTVTDQDLCMTLESGSFDALVERVRKAVPEMLELNCDYTGPVQIIFEIERADTIQVVV